MYVSTYLPSIYPSIYLSIYIYLSISILLYNYGEFGLIETDENTPGPTH